MATKAFEDSDALRATSCSLGEQPVGGSLHTPLPIKRGEERVGAGVSGRRVLPPQT